MKKLYNFIVTKKDGTIEKIDDALTFEVLAQNIFYIEAKGELNKTTHEFSYHSYWFPLDEIRKVTSDTKMVFDTKKEYLEFYKKLQFGS